MPTLYSLYRWYPSNRWCRVSFVMLPKDQAEARWEHKIKQGNLFHYQYSIRPIPKSEIRRQILEQYNSKNREGKHES